MRGVRAWLARLGGLFGGTRRDREFAEELESHLEMHIADNVRRGMTPLLHFLPSGPRQKPLLK